MMRALLAGEKYREQPLAEGQAGKAGSGAMELWVNPQSGTWTMVWLPRPEVACQLASGTEFKLVKAKGPEGQGT